MGTTSNEVVKGNKNMPSLLSMWHGIFKNFYKSVGKCALADSIDTFVTRPAVAAAGAAVPPITQEERKNTFKSLMKFGANTVRFAVSEIDFIIASLGAPSAFMNDGGHSWNIVQIVQGAKFFVDKVRFAPTTPTAASVAVGADHPAYANIADVADAGARPDATDISSHLALEIAGLTADFHAAAATALTKHILLNRAHKDVQQMIEGAYKDFLNTVKNATKSPMVTFIMTGMMMEPNISVDSIKPRATMSSVALISRCLEKCIREGKYMTAKKVVQVRNDAPEIKPTPADLVGDAVNAGTDNAYSVAEIEV